MSQLADPADIRIVGTSASQLYVARPKGMSAVFGMDGSADKNETVVGRNGQ